MNGEFYEGRRRVVSMLLEAACSSYAGLGLSHLFGDAFRLFSE